MQGERKIQENGSSLERLEAELAATRAERQEMMLRLKAGRPAGASSGAHRSWWIVSGALAAAVLSSAWLMVTEMQASAQSLPDPNAVNISEVVDEPLVVDTVEQPPAEPVVEEVTEGASEAIVEAADESPEPRVRRRHRRGDTERVANSHRAPGPGSAADSLADLDRCGNDPLCGGF